MEYTGSELPRSFAWHEVWREVFLHPSEQSFLRILADPQAAPRRAFLWVAVMALLGGLVQGIVMSVTGPETFGDSYSPIVGLLCGAIAAPLVAVIALALGAAIYHGIARLFGGSGTYDQMVYAYGAISAPVSLVSLVVSAIVIPFSRVGGQITPVLSLCIAPFSLALGIYAIVLYVLAVKAVERLDTGKAVLTVLLPTIVLFVLFFTCILLALVPLILRSTGGLP